jgi:hypothetical protein
MSASIGDEQAFRAATNLTAYHGLTKMELASIVFTAAALASPPKNDPISGESPLSPDEVGLNTAKALMERLDARRDGGAS